MGLGIAIFLTELCPLVCAGTIGTAIELLAGVPSIIYGMWGLFVLAPLCSNFRAQLSYADARRICRSCRRVFAGPPYGIGMFTAGIILAIMVLPFIAAISRDVFETVPPC